jgi:tubulin gamma
MFSDNLDEFNHSREVVASLVDEYKAAETASYVNYGLDKDSLPI